LARHGETEYNRCNQIQGRGIDISLNKTGRLQAKAIADHLCEINFQKVFSSSLKRSRETAQIVAREYSIDVESYEDLDEMNFGILEGRPASEIKDELENLHENWKSGNVHYAIENGESPTTVLKRADSRIESIIREHQSANLLFVLHGRLIRILVSHWLQYGLTEMHRIPHSNAALYHLRWDGELFDPIYLNKTEHLKNGSL
jgi:probable phosphoglycerate mutase